MTAVRGATRRKHWILKRELSTFVDWQRVKVQELSEEVRAELCTAE